MGEVAYLSPRSSTAFFETTKPLETGRVERVTAANGSFSTIVPVYLSLTTTSFSAGAQSPR